MISAAASPGARVDDPGPWIGRAPRRAGIGRAVEARSSSETWRWRWPASGRCRPLSRRAASIRDVDKVRDAMVSDPGALPGTASAREAGELLTRPEVRAVFVADGDRLTGVVTRKTLVARVVAEGRDPGTTTLASIAEEPHYTIGPEVPPQDAFRFLDHHDG